MKYLETYNFLKRKINYNDDIIDVDDYLRVYNFTFRSDNFHILPGETLYTCPDHEYVTDKCYNFDNKQHIIHDVLDIHDSQISENIEFRYHIFTPRKEPVSDKIVIMFHGFNEKYWYKYFPWAKNIVESTGKSVVLFPIAFHMNRAPQAWSDTRLMYEASNLRKELYPNIISSSLSNVAISTRIHVKPQRFIWSGLQTYYDVIQFIEKFKSGNHPIISSNASIDIFAYSIGAFLAQIIMMTNYKRYFEHSRLCMFCGGAVFNRLSPVSKFILDSEANVNLYSFIVEHLESHIKRDERLDHYLNDKHFEGLNFVKMLNYQTMSDLREDFFKQASNRLMAVTLVRDKVVPPYEVINTLQGKFRDIPVEVKVSDFPYNYKHEDPFPSLEKIKDKVDQEFNTVFKHICSFLADT